MELRVSVKKHNVKRSKRHSLIKKARHTRIEMTFYRHDKPTHILRLQRPLKSLPQPKGELVDLRKNPNKVVLYENRNPYFFQVYFYIDKPNMLAIVSGNRLIALPFDYAFTLKNALEKYIKILKEIGVSQNWKYMTKKRLKKIINLHFGDENG